MLVITETDVQISLIIWPDALQNLLKGVKDPKPFLHQAVGDSTRLPIEIVTYSNSASPEKIIAALKLLIDHGLDLNFTNGGT